MRMIEQRRANSGVIQRMPTSGAVTAIAGTPKRNINTRFIKTNRGEAYNKLLTALDQYQPMISATVNATATAIEGQALNLIRKLSDIIGFCDAHIASNSPKNKRTQEVINIRQQASSETAIIRTRNTYFQNQLRVAPGSYTKKTLPDPRPTWRSLVPQDMSNRVIDLSEATKTGEDSGALNTVGAYDMQGGRKGFFKADKAKMDEGDWEVDNEGRNYFPSPEEQNANQIMGIDKNNPQFANRAVAMYRIDQLLNANVIVRTDFAMEKSGKSSKSPVLGTISDAAPGEQQGNLQSEGRAVYDSAKQQQAAAAGKTAFTLEDPVYQRAMSKLNIVDALAFQIDRHPNNFFIDMDAHGNVRGVQGIDNDMAFPENDLDATVTGEKELMGIAKYIDKEIAEMVLALQDADLRAVLTGLISDNAIDKTVNRLHTLKIHIQASKTNGRLIDNLNSWTPQTATAEEPTTKARNEKRGYVGDFRNRYR